MMAAYDPAKRPGHRLRSHSRRKLCVEKSRQPCGCVRTMPTIDPRYRFEVQRGLRLVLFPVGDASVIGRAQSIVGRFPEALHFHIPF